MKLDFLVAQVVKCLTPMPETRVQSLGQEDPWRRKWHPTPVFLPGESHGQRSLVGYVPRVAESDTTEQPTKKAVKTLPGTDKRLTEGDKAAGFASGQILQAGLQQYVNREIPDV